ncbi:hypothetical protein QX204_13595 [Nocardia sp. PE-7]|uniref:hypothetical protein n=1 Tax=Nocardia sp. PE-7 TaxID=3058426 RepID=UPI002657B796|nr:hypothetical protein [Nocardia sp. PE-7]WKG12438.1 hypothetical protein QX204_13595 [Nocardia sp. PE-7]
MTTIVAGNDHRAGHDIPNDTTAVPATASIGLAAVVNSGPSTSQTVHNRYAHTTANSHVGCHCRRRQLFTAHTSNAISTATPMADPPRWTEYTTATRISTHHSMVDAIRSTRARTAARVEGWVMVDIIRTLGGRDVC